MPYDSRSTGPLTPEERDVQAALARYCTPSKSDRDFTPVEPLYRLYVNRHLECYQSLQARDDHPLLSRNQFGHALRRVFPGTRRCKRAVARRKRQWGYVFLTGDFAIVTRPPRRRKASAAML